MIDIDLNQLRNEINSAAVQQCVRHLTHRSQVECLSRVGASGRIQKRKQQLQFVDASVAGPNKGA